MLLSSIVSRQGLSIIGVNKFKGHSNNLKPASNVIVNVKLYCDKSAQDGERRDSLLTDEMIERISAGSEEMKNKLKYLEYEFMLAQQDGGLVPTVIEEMDWHVLLTLESRQQRLRYLTKLCKAELRKEEKIKQKEIKQRISNTPSEHGDSKVSRSENRSESRCFFKSIFLRLQDKSFNQFHQGKCLNALMYGIPLVYDLGFHQQMNGIEQKNAARELIHSYGINHTHNDPFDMRFLNNDPNSILFKSLAIQNPEINEPYFPITVSSQSYLDMYPREQLVYLTPDAHEVMREFDPEKIYIIGAVNKKSEQRDFMSVAKAKRDNLQMLKLPLGIPSPNDYEFVCFRWIFRLKNSHLKNGSRSLLVADQLNGIPITQ